MTRSKALVSQAAPVDDGASPVLAAGAASDTIGSIPELLDQAERALALVQTTDQAETLWRKVTAVEHAARLAKAHGEMQLRVGRTKLRAERLWGELLGAAEDQPRSDDGTFRVTASNTASGSDRVARHRAREVAAVPAEVFDGYLSAVKDPENLRRARLLRVSREHAAAERAESFAMADIPATVELRLGDFRTELDDVAGIDAIITDPPYPAEYDGLYPALAEFAARALKPTGSLVVLCGTRPSAWLRRLPAMEEHLPLRWVGCYLTPGSSYRDQQAKIATNWKPLLIFGADRSLNTDVFRSTGDDKRHHHWGQNEQAFAQIVESFTDPGGIVCDPFVGGGTTAVVAYDLGRSFIGCDTDAVALNHARARLAQ